MPKFIEIRAVQLFGKILSVNFKKKSQRNLTNLPYKLAYLTDSCPQCMAGMSLQKVCFHGKISRTAEKATIKIK